MSMSLFKLNTPTTPAARSNRIHYATALARYVRRRRQELGMTVELSAKLAGIETSEWDALESGWVPSDEELIWAIAGTLEVCQPQISLLAWFSQHSQAQPA
jgi:hypothetical protein